MIAFEATEEDTLVDRMRCVQTNTQTYPLTDDLPIAKCYRWCITLAIIKGGEAWVLGQVRCEELNVTYLFAR